MVDGVDAQFFSATLAGCTLSKARPALTVFRALFRMDSEWLTRMIAANLYVYDCDVKDGDGSDASRKNPREGDEGDCRLRKHAGVEGRGGRIRRALGEERNAHGVGEREWRGGRRSRIELAWRQL